MNKLEKLVRHKLVIDVSIFKLGDFICLMLETLNGESLKACEKTLEKAIDSAENQLNELFSSDMN